MNNKIELIEIKRNQTGSGILIENDGYISASINGNKKLFETLREGFENNNEWKVPNPFIVSAVFQKYGIKNANGRIYPEQVLKRQVDEYLSKIRDNSSFGELNHPSSSSIDGGRISHIIRELHWEGHTLVGKIELHLSPGYIKFGVISTMGDMAANLLLSGYKIGVSSRGVGSVEQNRMGQYVVGDDFELVCWDIVTDPSTPGAWIAPDMADLKPYMENKTDKDISLLEKIDKISSLLL